MWGRGGPLQRNKDGPMLDRKLALAFQELGVTPDVSEKELRAARLKLVRRFHPDLFVGNRAVADRKLARINAAYDDVKAHLAGQSPTPKPAKPRSANREDAARRARARTAAAQANERDRARRQARATEDRLKSLRASIAEAETKMTRPDRSAHQAARKGFAAVRAIFAA